MQVKATPQAKAIISALVLALLLLSGLNASAQDGIREDGRIPATIVGTYSTTYYANFSDWPVFPVLLPMINPDRNLPYDQRFDLSAQGQIKGNLRGDVVTGDYIINLPDNPTHSAWFDTDGDPATPSDVKLFLVGIANGMVAQDHISRYDFAYARSFNFDPNTRLWSGYLLAWSASEGATFPILNGLDNRYYTDDDIFISLPVGWSIIEVQADPAAGTEQVRHFQTSRPVITLHEPPYLEDVDLRGLSYPDAFQTLLSNLASTYVFTDYRSVDWAALQQKFSPRAQAVSNDQEFQQLLQDTLFTFRDGHLAIYGAGLPTWLWGSLGLQVYPYEHDLIVVEVMSNSPAGRSEIRPGTVITAVNGQAAENFFAAIPRSIYSGGHQTQEYWFRGGLAFRGEPGTSFNIAYRQPDNSIGGVELRTQALNEISDARPSPYPSDPLYYDILPSGIGLVGVRNFTSAQVASLWDEALEQMLAANVAGIIIDLRFNGGGFSAIGNYIIGHFLDEDVYSGREISLLDEDGDGEIDIRDKFYYGQTRHYDPSRVAVLIGPNCFSACEFTAQGFQDIGATVIGHLPSGGAGGGVGASYYLPGETRVYGMAIVRSEDPDGQIMIEGRGVSLDVQVPFAPQALASGADALLEAAQAWLLE